MQPPSQLYYWFFSNLSLPLLITVGVNTRDLKKCRRKWSRTLCISQRVLLIVCMYVCTRYMDENEGDNYDNNYIFSTNKARFIAKSSD